MICKAKYKIVVSCLVLVFALMSYNSTAQRPDINKKVTVKFSNHKISEVFHILSSETKIKFSYDPNLINDANTVTANFINQPLSTVLRAIIPDESIQFKVIGNQVVFYSDSEEKTPEKTKIEKTIIPDKIHRVNVPYKPDTVYIYRSDSVKITKYDTVRQLVSRTDTITISNIINDTVYFDSRSNMLNQKYFFGDLYTSFQPIDFKTFNSTPEINEQYEKSIGSTFAVEYGIGAGYNSYKSQFVLQASVVNLFEKYNYTFDNSFGGFYDIDTLEIYYSIIQNDTTWFYITDSTWIPLDSKIETHNLVNKYRYLNLSASFAHNIITRDTWNCYLIGGAGIRIPLKIDANYLVYQDEKFVPNQINIDNLNKPQIYALAGVGFREALNSKVIFYQEINTLFNFTETYKDIKFYKQKYMLGFKLGIRYKF